MRNPGGAVVALLLAGALTACADGLPIDRLPPAASGPGPSGVPSPGAVVSGGTSSGDGVPVAGGDALGADGHTWVGIVGLPGPDLPPQPVGIDPPADALESFRRLEDECSRYSALVGRGDPGRTPPRVEPGRFRDAALVAEIDGDTALVVDGRGTRLVLDGWYQEQPVLLPESGRPDLPLPEPYRRACPSLFVEPPE